MSSAEPKSREDLSPSPLYANSKPSRPLGEENCIREIVAACGKKATRVVQYSKWLLKIDAAQYRLLSTFIEADHRDVQRAARR